MLAQLMRPRSQRKQSLHFENLIVYRALNMRILAPNVAARSDVCRTMSPREDPAWKEACRREEVIHDLLRRYPERLTVRAVEDVAWEA